jgi:hypothetical protein
MAEEQEKYQVMKTEDATSALITASTSLFFNVAKFEHAQRVARVLMASTIVPEHFRNNIGNCVIALNYAERIQADPFMVMQNMYIVHGRPGVEGKLIIALINQSGKYSEPLKFRFDGTGDEYGCTAYTRDAKSGELVEGTKITAKLVKAEGWDKPKGQFPSKWTTMPDLMYRYRAASWFASTNCPELKLGMSTVEEINDFVDLVPNKNGKYSAPEPEPINTEKFTSLVNSKKCDFEKLAEFITLSAKNLGRSEDELKALAQDNFEDFWRDFEKWSAKQVEPQKEAASEGPKPEEKKKPGKDKLELKGEPKTHVNCPECNNEPVSVKACLSCSERENCKARP